MFRKKERSQGHGRWQMLMLLSAALLSACTSVGRLAPDSAAPGPGEAVLVLGAQPANLAAIWNYGTVQDGRFIEDVMTLVPPIKAVPSDGYLVAKVKAGSTLGVVRWSFARDDGFYTGEVYTPCADTRTMVVELPRSGVYYLGDVQHTSVDRKLQRKFNVNLKAAQDHLDHRYAALKGKLEQAQVQWLPTNQHCHTSVVVPIIIPRAR